MKILENFHTVHFNVRLRRANQIRKRVIECYVRNDIHCGIMECRVCEAYEQTKGSLNVPCLEGCPTSDSTQFASHYLIPDANTLMDYIDVFEDDAVTNVIVLLSVLHTIRSRSSVVYRRILDITVNKNRKFYLFDNEHSIFTFVERPESATLQIHATKLFIKSVQFYFRHVKGVNLVVLADDNELSNSIKSIVENVSCVSLPQYVATMRESRNILESKVRHKVIEKTSSSEKPIFPAYLPSDAIYDDIKRGTLLQGKFYVNGHNFLEGSVSVESFDKPILISGYKNINRAIDSDVVAVRLLPIEEWAVPLDIVLEDDENADLDSLERKIDEESQLVKQKGAIDRQPSGQIVGIIRRKRNQCCGIIEKNVRGVNRLQHIFTPADRKYPKVVIDTRNIDNLVGKKLVVAIDDWPRYSRYPLGHFVRIIGEIGDKDAENEVLLLEHDVPFSKFSDRVKRDLPTLPWIITSDDLNRRKDLRNYYICSVDPPGCTDIDDALHCFANSDGTYSVGVHIADVSHFIRPNTALDEEAAKRGTTVYLVDKRIDMVPELLSSNLCSLRENEERFAFSCCWILDENANIISTDFFKSIICSKRAFTYEEAQHLIDDPLKKDLITQSLRGLNKLAKILKKRRLENGALVLSSPEVRFHVDSETHDPLDVQIKKYYDTMSMVEEFMLLANISVAKKIYNDFPECAVLRRHPEPPISNFEPLVKAARNHGFTIHVESNSILAQSLDNAIKKKNPMFNNMLRILATRCMQQAVYFSSGTLAPKDYYHYGLAVDFYTHFTSPIRRYADIMVHRLLAASIGADSTYSALLDSKCTTKICENLNYRNRMAQYAGRASVALNTHRFFRNKTLQERGSILFVRKNALHVLVTRFGLEGTIYLEPPEGNRRLTQKLYYPKFEYNSESQTIVINDNVTLKTFDSVLIELKIDSTNVQREKIVFTMLEPTKIGTPIIETQGSSSAEEGPSDEIMNCQNRRQL